MVMGEGREVGARWRDERGDVALTKDEYLVFTS